MAAEDASLAIRNALLHVNEAEQMATQGNIETLSVADRLLFSIAYATIATAVSSSEERFTNDDPEPEETPDPVFSEEELQVVKRFLEAVPREAIDSVFVDSDE